MPSLLIDDSGNVWPAQGHAIVERFTKMRLRRNIVAQAIDLGFVFVNIGDNGTNVAFRTHFIAMTSLSSVCDMIASRNSGRVALSFDPHLSSWELIAEPQLAIRRIERIVADARQPSPPPLLTTQALSLDRAHEIGEGRLSPLLRAWSETDARWEPGIPDRLEEHNLLDHCVVSRRPRGSERFLIEHWGRRRSSLYGALWARIANGRDLADQPNHDLGQWNAAAALRATTTSEPRLLAFDLVMRTPDSRLVRRTYKRLMLPWRTIDREAILTTVDVGVRTLVLEVQPVRPN
jgi:hypothetical protein